MKTFFIIAFFICVALTIVYYAAGMADDLMLMSMVTTIIYIRITRDKE